MNQFFLRNLTSDEPAYHCGGEDDMAAVMSSFNAMMLAEIQAAVEMGEFPIEFQIERKEMTAEEVAAIPEF